MTQIELRNGVKYVKANSVLSCLPSLLQTQIDEGWIIKEEVIIALKDTIKALRCKSKETNQKRVERIFHIGHTNKD